MTIEARRVQRGVSGALLTLALVLLATAQVAQADTIYPDNIITGSAFDNGLSNPGGSGWTEGDNDCTVLVGLLPSTNPQVCQTHTEAADGIGTPPGSLQQSYNGTADGLAPILFKSTARASSSPFTIAAITGGASGKTTFQFDRRANVDAILNLSGQATYTFSLVDITAGGTSIELYKERLDDSNNNFAGALRDPMPNVIPTHTYRIEIDTVFDCGVLCVGLDETQANFDNIRLRVVDGSPRFGPPTVLTHDATDITESAATLNGEVNAQGHPTTFVYRIGTNPAFPATAETLPLFGPFNGGQLTDSVDRSRTITGLLPCKVYYYRIEATNTAGTATKDLTAHQFRTDCAPTPVTLEANAAVSSATLQSSINPNGATTTYYYDWGPDAPDGTPLPSRVPAVNAGPIGDGDLAVQPNGITLAGLAPQTIYRYEVVAVNVVGTTRGGVKKFTTTGLGLQGTPGTNGAPGTNGTNGTNGTAGAPGARGPAGAKGTTGSSTLDLNSGDKRAMIRIDAQVISVPAKGRNVGRVRVQIFCRRIAVRTCSGTMKVRSLDPILPQSFGAPPKAKRRVSFATDAVQLDIGKIGFGILNFNAQRRSLLKREKRVRSTVIVTVIDADNNRQNVRKVVTVALGK